jgi:hypothetical protein
MATLVETATGPAGGVPDGLCPKVSLLRSIALIGLSFLIDEIGAARQ